MQTKPCKSVNTDSIRYRIRKCDHKLLYKFVYSATRLRKMTKSLANNNINKTTATTKQQQQEEEAEEWYKKQQMKTLVEVPYLVWTYRIATCAWAKFFILFIYLFSSLVLFAFLFVSHTLYWFHAHTQSPAGTWAYALVLRSTWWHSTRMTNADGCEWWWSMKCDKSILNVNRNLITITWLAIQNCDEEWVSVSVCVCAHWVNIHWWAGWVLNSYVTATKMLACSRQYVHQQ